MKNKKVFIATSGFINFIDKAQPKHLLATAQFRYFAQNNYQLYTTTATINDTYRILYSTISPRVARDFLKAIKYSNINLLYSDELITNKAIQFITDDKHDPLEISLTYAIMVTVCDRKNIPEVCIFNPMLRLFGLNTFNLPV